MQERKRQSSPREREEEQGGGDDKTQESLPGHVATRNGIGSARMLASVAQTYSDILTSVFSSTIAAKAWLASAAALLAIVQVSTGARIFGKIKRFVPIPPPVREPHPPLVGADRRAADAAGRVPLHLHPRLPDA